MLGFEPRQSEHTSPPIISRLGLSQVPTKYFFKNKDQQVLHVCVSISQRLFFFLHTCVSLKLKSVKINWYHQLMISCFYNWPSKSRHFNLNGRTIKIYSIPGAVWPEKITKCLQKLPKNDPTRKLIDWKHPYKNCLRICEIWAN